MIKSTDDGFEYEADVKVPRNNPEGEDVAEDSEGQDVAEDYEGEADAEDSEGEYVAEAGRFRGRGLC